MVLEAFAALSLAANIIQFVDFSGKLFTKARQAHRSENGATQEYADLESTLERLESLKEELVSSTSTVSQSPGTTGGERELAILAKDCTELADEFSTLLKSLKGRGKAGKLESLLQAARVMLKDNDINLAKSRLKEFQTRVTVCLLTILRSNQSNVTKMLVELSHHAGREETRAKDLLAWKASVTKKLRDIQSSSDNAVNYNDNLSSKLSEIASDLSEWATTGNRIATQHRILKSLHFEAMNVRHTQIPEAHSKTFEWAYTSRSITDRSCKQFKFAEWLRSGDGHYWIAGKPGSGKSTLVKFLYDNPRTLLELEDWRGQKELVTAGFFFWNSGTEKQRSIEGLLQSLLFEILRKCPTLIPIVAPQRWQEQSLHHSEFTPWLQREIKDTFRRIQEQGTISSKFCFFIDGLDEYGGDQSDLIKILQDLTLSSDIKLCISSRPWNIFQDAFAQDTERKLLLEDLTKPDIERFVRDKLESSPQFMSLITRDSRYDELVEEIVQKADGVFLWVFLIVRSLLHGLVNCDRLSELQRRIRLLPSTLEDYFLHILSNMDEAYSERAAETFEIALKATYPLSLLTYSYIDEDDPYYGINAEIKELSPQETICRLQTMKRRINARCNGLLEITIDTTKENPPELFKNAIGDPGDLFISKNGFKTVDLFRTYKVDFLHRTVRDFLHTEEIQKMLRQNRKSDIQPLSMICQALLAEVKAIPTGRDFGYLRYAHLIRQAADNILYYARVSDEEFRNPEVQTLDELERTLLVLSSNHEIEGAILPLSDVRGLGFRYGSFYELVVQAGLSSYVCYKLRSSSGKRSQPSLKQLLAVAVIPLLSEEGTVHFPSMFRLLTDALEEQRTEDWTAVALPSLWVQFLANIPYNLEMLSKGQTEAVLQIIYMFLDIGADPNEQSVAWESTLQDPDGQCEGHAAWESTLQELKDQVGEGRFRVSGNEVMEFIEKYRNIFLAYEWNRIPQRPLCK
ncbi:hypothetical protein COCMIDRAFT_21484 [Bipolaris oryzae ATCC 44560]|uniref:Uncharacterized protein n=1 Tax=Bipolaris oryzae ATCC 44560 TaxID=930090 RepID=W6ZGV3_COCMI|nr:uncharacterized protein COCMIDRAFT_21484 [Bipolaris oryzae ATCC 44560]EUC51097.1 hypothetical protein COCMIDRAFT_21484 [Bipolaris oryzae ATCC 44560]